MPLYDYQCAECGRVEEMFRSMERRNDPARCPQCEGAMRLRFAAPRALRTDTAFQAGFHGDGCANDLMRRQLHANARRMGINIQGKRYDPRLAKFPGDPNACYATVAEARRAVAYAGRGSDDLGVKPPPDETAGRSYRVADDIVERYAREVVLDNHGGRVTRHQWETIKEEVRERITPKPAKLPDCLKT